MLKLRSLFYFLTLLAARTALAGGGGDDIGNGGGLAEKNFLIALNSLATYAKPCLELDVCRLTADEKKVLGDIIAVMPQELRVADLLQFRSGAQNPGFFVLDCALKVAKTGSRVGVPIYINTDLIYYKNRFGGDEAMQVPMALAVLIHELGHHVSSETHAQLDLLGVKVSSFLQNRAQTTPALPWSQAIMATVIQSLSPNTFPQVLLTVGADVLDLSQLFDAALYCPKFTIPIPVLPFPDLQLGREKPLGAVFHNVHWAKAALTSSEGDYVIEGSLMNACQSQSALVAVNSFKARIYFTVSGAADELQVKPGSLRVEEAYEPWYKLIRLPEM